MKFLFFAIFLSCFVAGKNLKDPFYPEDDLILMAIFEDCALINNEWACQGEIINGMKIQKVKDDFVVLAGDFGLVSLKLGKGINSLR